MSDDYQTLIHAWLQAVQARKQWTDHEMKLRLQLAAHFGYDPSKEHSIRDGTHRSDLGNGYALKLVTGTTYDVKDGPELRAAIEAVRQLNTPLPVPLVSWKPSLSLRAYDAAPEHVKTLLQPAITTKNKAPTLELEEPKK